MHWQTHDIGRCKNPAVCLSMCQVDKKPSTTLSKRTTRPGEVWFFCEVLMPVLWQQCCNPFWHLCCCAQPMPITLQLRTDDVLRALSHPSLLPPILNFLFSMSVHTLHGGSMWQMTVPLTACLECGTVLYWARTFRSSSATAVMCSWPAWGFLSCLTTAALASALLSLKPIEQMDSRSPDSWLCLLQHAGELSMHTLGLAWTKLQWKAWTTWQGWSKWLV